MTARELIARTDRLRPNTLPFEEKLKWLEELELRAFQEVILTHEHEAGLTFRGPGEGEGELLIPAPFREVYHYYLCMQMDLTGREMVMYNNDRALFENAWTAWQDHVNRSLMPESKANTIKI